jgi:DNA repair exonuclease SbcCD nuclease subunit
VLDNSSVFIPYRMGNTFVMVHHGNKTKAEKLISVMASDFRQDWGETEFRYIDIGHYHHKMQVREEGGATVEMWNTLAAKDRYGHDGGWRAGQSITRVDRSKTDGEVGRRVLPVQAVRRAIKRQGAGHYEPPDRQNVHSV